MTTDLQRLREAFLMMTTVAIIEARRHHLPGRPMIPVLDLQRELGL